ncbi:MAG: CD225/dispanin family protein [Bacteroidales bacterium]
MKNSKITKSWLLQSVLASLAFFYFPVGVIGVVYAIKSIIKMGGSGENDAEEAEMAARKAKKWTIIAFGVGAVLLVVLYLRIILSKHLGC